MIRVLLRPLLGRTRRQLTCQRTVELVTDYLEGALPDRQRARFEAHLAGCVHCTRYLEQMGATIRALGHLEVASVPPEVLAELVTVYRRVRSDRRAGD